VTEIRLGLAVVFTILVTFLLPAIFVVIGVTGRARAIRVPPHGASTELDLAAVQQIRALRAMLSSALTWLAIPVSSIVIVTGQLRSALIADNAEVDTHYPVAYLLLYGAMFASVLGALYLPAYTSLRQRSRVLVDETYPFDGTLDWEDNHARLTDYLGLSGGIFENAKTTVSTLSPFLAGLVAAVVPSTF
jgi:hypothetical protein